MVRFDWDVRLSAGLGWAGLRRGKLIGILEIYIETLLYFGSRDQKRDERMGWVE